MANTLIETGRGLTSLNPTASAMSNTTTETTLFTQTLTGGCLGTNKAAKFMLVLDMTTVLLPPTVTIRVKLGTSVLTIGSGLTLTTNTSAAPFVVEGLIVNKNASNIQFAYARILQNGAAPLGALTGSIMNVADWTIDTSVDQTFLITAQFGSSVATTTLDYRYGEMVLT